MNDKEIRVLLDRTEFVAYNDDPLSKVVHEFCVFDARIDVAVINDSLHGYEIKSAVDTLKRLPAQIEAYSKVFDYLTVYTENNHYGAFIASYPIGLGYVCVRIAEGL